MRCAGSLREAVWGTQEEVGLHGLDGTEAESVQELAWRPGLQYLHEAEDFNCPVFCGLCHLPEAWRHEEFVCFQVSWRADGDSQVKSCRWQRAWQWPPFFTSKWQWSTLSSGEWVWNCSRTWRSTAFCPEARVSPLLSLAWLPKRPRSPLPSSHLPNKNQQATSDGKAIIIPDEGTVQFRWQACPFVNRYLLFFSEREAHVLQWWLTRVSRWNASVGYF